MIWNSRILWADDKYKYHEKIRSLKKTLAILQTSHAFLQTSLTNILKRPLKLPLANLIIDTGKYAVRQLGRWDLIIGHFTHDLQRFVKNLSDKRVATFSQSIIRWSMTLSIVSSKQSFRLEWILTRMQYIEGRNSAAHEIYIGFFRRSSRLHVGQLLLRSSCANFCFGSSYLFNYSWSTPVEFILCLTH